MPLHETTRRALCRVAFLALCVAPTVAVLAWAAGSNSSSRVAEAERELAAALELAVEIDDIAYPRPGVAVYSGVVLRDAETRRVVAEAERVEAVETSEGTSLIAAHIEADAAMLDCLWRAVDRRLRVGRATGGRPLRISVERFTLHGRSSGQSVTFTSVGGQIVYDEQFSRAGVRFSLPESASSEPVQVVVRRTHNADPPTTRLELRTGGAALPLAVLHSVFPSLKHVGDRADFAGQLWATQRGEGHDGWGGEAAGRLRRVDLDALVARQFPHKLSGEAEITLRRLAFADGRLVRLDGSFDGGPGVVGRSLVDAAVVALGMRAAGGRNQDSGAAAEVNPRDDLAKYDRLAVTFEIDGEQATLRGICPASAAAADEADNSDGGALCVLCDSFGPVLFEAERQPQSPLGLVRLLAPDADLQVPATRETDWLLRRLPVPAANSSEDRRSPRGSLRDATVTESAG